MSAIAPAAKAARLYRSFRTALVEKNISSTMPTRYENLLSLIQLLKPVCTGYELIRVGNQADGGYLIPDDLEGIEYCFSPGVGCLSEFENGLADRHIHSFMADYSIEKPRIMRPEFTFDKMYLGSSTRDNVFTLEYWKNKYLPGYTGDLLLEMDVEGAEYEVILSTPDALLNQFRIAVIEFHGLHRLFDGLTFSLFNLTFEKILRFFDVVHLHPNSYMPVVKRAGIEIPSAMEFTFHNKKREKSLTPRAIFPNVLDADNNPKQHIVLPKCWYD